MACAADSGTLAASFASACGSGLRVGLLEMLAVTCAASGQASGRQVYTPVLLLKKLLRPAHLAGSGFLIVTRVVPWASAGETASTARTIAHRPVIRMLIPASRPGNSRSPYSPAACRRHPSARPRPSALSAPASSMSNTLPWRTLAMPSTPSDFKAPSMALPCGSRMPDFSVTVTRAFICSVHNFRRHPEVLGNEVAEPRRAELVAILRDASRRRLAPQDDG